MTSSLETVQTLYAAFARQDIPAVLGLLSPQIDWKYHGPPAIPFAGHFHGREQLGTFFQRVGESTEIHQFETRELVERGDTVIVYGWERCTARKTGKSWECDWVHIWTVEDGAIARLREFYDTFPKANAYLGREV